MSCPKKIPIGNFKIEAIGSQPRPIYTIRDLVNKTQHQNISARISVDVTEISVDSTEIAALPIRDHLVTIRYNYDEKTLTEQNGAPLGATDVLELDTIDEINKFAFIHALNSTSNNVAVYVYFFST
ncbi:MAG: hypothetical protein K0B10_07125 [Vicingaceae bacterium]|nr:hypothetical protein [Vicingaceae bacterium]